MDAEFNEDKSTDNVVYLHFNHAFLANNLQRKLSWKLEREEAEGQVEEGPEKVEWQE